MGIGNLNNNFGSLTAGGVNKTTNLKNTAKAETTVKNNVSFNADSLKSATLSDKEGVKFDSDNMTDKTEALYAPKGKGKGKTNHSYTAITEKEWNYRGGVENYNGKGADEMGFSVWVSSTLQWAFHKIVGLFK